MKSFHGERRPSAGIHVYEGMGNCFACGKTFSLAELVAECMDFKLVDGSYNYFKANMWLEEKFNVEYKVIDPDSKIIRLDDEDSSANALGANRNPDTGRFELPNYYIAPFRSGKQTHNYFFERGFTKETVKTFKVGWDAVRMRVTVPVFWKDGTLCGVIGRVVLPEKINGKFSKKYKRVYKVGNETRYFIYENFPTGEILFPLPQFKPRKDGLAVLVEGQYDCMWLHQLGFHFVLSTLGSKLAYDNKLKVSEQVELLKELGVKKVLLLRDNDEAGQKGNEHDYKLLKHDFAVYKTEYPKGVSDPKELTKKEFIRMLRSMSPYKLGAKTLRID